MKDQDPFQLFERFISFVYEFAHNNNLVLKKYDHQYDYLYMMAWKHPDSYMRTISISLDSNVTFSLDAGCYFKYRKAGYNIANFRSNIDKDSLIGYLNEAKLYTDNCEEPLNERNKEYLDVYLEQVTSDANPAIRSIAISKLIEIGTPRAIEGVLLALHDNNDNVRITAIRAFVQLMHMGRFTRQFVSNHINEIFESCTPFLSNILNRQYLEFIDNSK